MVQFLLVFIAGCAAGSGPRPFDPSDVIIREIPFFPHKNDEYMCGPSALASVLNFYGTRVKSDDVASKIFVPEIKGTLTIDLFLYAKSLGFGVKFYNGGLGDLKLRIRRGTPLILFLNMGTDFYPIGHYVVPTGFNDEKETVYAHSGMERDRAFSYGKLLDAWGSAGFQTLLITPKGRVKEIKSGGDLD